MVILGSCLQIALFVYNWKYLYVCICRYELLLLLLSLSVSDAFYYIELNGYRLCVLIRLHLWPKSSQFLAHSAHWRLTNTFCSTETQCKLWNLNCNVLESGLPLSPPTTRWYNDTCGLLVHTQGQLPPLWHTFADGRSHSYSCFLHPHQDKINTPPIPSAE